MKRTQSISIANALFHIEEDAYEMLEKYLRGIREHFKSVPEHDEIISDIEARIAEQFIEKTGESRIVTREHVESLVKSMGAPEELGGEETEPASTKPEGTRRLYRDGDNMIIAGVASGIAAFFGIDPVIVRILFVLSLFAGGFGIVIYLILWLIVPLATTTTEKLEMKGNAVTLESVKNAVQEKINEVKPPKGTFMKIIEFPVRVIGAVFTFVRTKLFPIIGTVLGILIFVGGSALFIGFTFLLVVGAFDVAGPYFDPAWRELLEGGAYYAVLISAYLALVIPAIFIVTLGLILIRKKNPLASRTGFTLLGIWFAALIGAGVSGVAFADRVHQFVETSPALETTEQVVELGAFESINVRNGVRVIVSQGETQSMILRGTSRQIQRTAATVEEGALTIESKWQRDCILCDHSPAEAVIVVSSLESIRLENGSRIVSEGRLALPNLLVTAENGSRVELDLLGQSVEANAENFSFITLTGEADALKATLKNSSRLSALDFTSKSTDIMAENASRANIGETATLDAISRNASRIYYVGNPTISESTAESEGSRIRPLEEQTEDEWYWD